MLRSIFTTHPVKVTAVDTRSHVKVVGWGSWVEGHGVRGVEGEIQVSILFSVARIVCI